ncbi:hypothetical protein DPMN_179624 [Dreissena polymorpha]|uniref:Uncharacterized protein n=1 Tax=Dreissena polymorpha TaxID=45954 RepID=A0A9D4EEC3_DREPO|nr:hypothetical protein DPMN_179624 [Dreissena polymorpha]
MVRGLKFVPGQSRTHTVNQGIAGRYKASPDPKRYFNGPTRMPSSSRFDTDEHGSFELPLNAVLASGSQRTKPDVPGPTRVDKEIHGGYTVYMPDRTVLIRHLYGMGLYNYFV